MDVPAGLDAQPGIYAGWVWLEDTDGQTGGKYPAAFHYGPVPAFGETANALEAHVIGKDIPTPPPRLDFELVKYLREIRDFKDLEALKAQIGEDVQQTLAALGEV